MRRIATHRAKGSRGRSSPLPPLLQIGAQLAHAAPKALPQQGAQGCAIDIADFGGDGVHAQAAALQQRAGPFHPQILEIGEP